MYLRFQTAALSLMSILFLFLIFASPQMKLYHRRAALCLIQHLLKMVRIPILLTLKAKFTWEMLYSVLLVSLGVEVKRGNLISVTAGTFKKARLLLNKYAC